MREALASWSGAVIAVLILPLTLLLIYAAWLSRLKARVHALCGHYVHSLPQLPLIGNALQLLSLRHSSDHWSFVRECSDKYKQGAMVWLFHIPWLFLQDVEVVEAVLTSSESIEKSHVYRLLAPITEGIFTAEAWKWKKLRKKLNLTFSQRQLDMIYKDVNEQTEICVNVLRKNTNKHINIMSFMTTFFLDSVSRTHFGIATEEQTNRNAYITETAAKIIELTIEHRVFRTFNHFSPIFFFTRVRKFINFTRAEPLVFIRQMIGQRLEDAEKEKARGEYEEKKRIYYVDVAVEALEEMNIPPTAYNLERNTADMLIAASDTTSIAVSAVFYYLAVYPEIQEKVFQEILPIFGENSTMQFTKEDLGRMEYLEMVIKETLRHTGPPGIIRELTKDLDVGKYVIPKGTNVYLILISIHKNPEFYERAEEFYPEHFLPEKVKERPKFAFLPFSSGPRNCPGMAYSYVTMKCIISSVVRNFKLETNMPVSEVKYKMILMQEHENGYFIKLTPRQPQQP